MRGFDIYQMLSILVYLVNKKLNNFVTKIIFMFSRMYSASSAIEANNHKNAWQEDKIKAYALCPSYVDTAILGPKEKE